MVCHVRPWLEPRRAKISTTQFWLVDLNIYRPLETPANLLRITRGLKYLAPMHCMRAQKENISRFSVSKNDER